MSSFTFSILHSYLSSSSLSSYSSFPSILSTFFSFFTTTTYPSLSLSSSPSTPSSYCSFSSQLLQSLDKTHAWHAPQHNKQVMYGTHVRTSTWAMTAPLLALPRNHPLWGSSSTLVPSSLTSTQPQLHSLLADLSCTLVPSEWSALCHGHVS